MLIPEHISKRFVLTPQINFSKSPVLGRVSVEKEGSIKNVIIFYRMIILQPVTTSFQMSFRISCNIFGGFEFPFRRKEDKQLSTWNNNNEYFKNLKFSRSSNNIVNNPSESFDKNEFFFFNNRRAFKCKLTHSHPTQKQRFVWKFNLTLLIH